MRVGWARGGRHVEPAESGWLRVFRVGHGDLYFVRAGSIDVEFRATAVQTDGSLNIRVLSPSGAPIENQFVSIRPAPAGMGSVAVMKGKQHVSNARSDAEGRFVVVVEAGDPGPYSLRGMVQIPGGNAHGAFAKGVQPGATGVELRFETIK